MAKLQLSNVDFNNASRILNLPDGATPQEPATVAQLNAAVEGLAWKDSWRVATQSNLNLASPGAMIDGVSMVLNDRVLVRVQTSQPENGSYIWNGASTPMTRSPDCNTAAELEGAVGMVEEGSSVGVSYRQQTVNFTLGSGNVVWTTFGQNSPPASDTTAGIAELATQAEVDAGSDTTRVVTPATLAAYSGRVKKVEADVGDGSATRYPQPQHPRR